MKLPTPLVTGTLIKRYKRFLADVKLDSGELITASCPNTGSMMGLKEEGNRVWLSTSDNPKRKYKHTWEMVEVAMPADPTCKTIVGINTGRPNKIVAEAINNGLVPELAGYDSLRHEVKYGENSRIDLLLESDSKPPCYVEIKNVTLLRNGTMAEFPDGATARGVKHLRELNNMVSEGARSVMLYLIQRADAESFSFADDIDKDYFAAFKEASAGGVEALAYRCHMSEQEIIIDRTVPLQYPTTQG